MAFRGKRSFLQGPYFYDTRYGLREHISDLNWQRGQFIKDLDTMLVGEREAMINRVFMAPSKEMQPDDKLTQPSLRGDDDDVLFSS